MGIMLLNQNFGYITNGTGVQPSSYSHYGLPVDIVDLSTGQDPAKLVDFLQMVKKKIQKEGEDSSDSDDESCIQEESSLSES
ncbi:Cell division cycle protein [Armadillidium vulgare]|nr:Cell division cycle protein [Armadillidium vulgare]